MNNPFSKPNVYMAMREGKIRTYGDLITVAAPSSTFGTCCACHSWNTPTWQLSTRASICQKCCERKSNEVLGSIATAERKARSYVRAAIKRGEDVTKQLRFYAHLSRAPEKYIEAEYRAQIARRT
jgi:hypothetical protein